MDQIKIGAFLRNLRKEKGLTQEQLAEKFNVSNRTVSRWENGNNMPDLDILIEISDFYEIELRELLDGERKVEEVNKEVEETVLKAVDYSNSETLKYMQRIRITILIGAVLWLVSGIISHTGLDDVYAMRCFSDFAEGAATGVLLVGIFITSRLGQKVKAFKKRLAKR